VTITQEMSLSRQSETQRADVLYGNQFMDSYEGINVGETERSCGLIIWQYVVKLHFMILYAYL